MAPLQTQPPKQPNRPERVNLKFLTLSHTASKILPCCWGGCGRLHISYLFYISICSFLTAIMSVKKSGTTTIDDIVNSNSTDRLQVFIMSWNMGNAPPTGLEYVFREKNATNDFDILVLGLQEATWPATDCIKILSDTVHGVVGEKYFLVSRYILQNSTLSISHRTPRF
mgnify:CR=1 FL=1